MSKWKRGDGTSHEKYRLGNGITAASHKKQRVPEQFGKQGLLFEDYIGGSATFRPLDAANKKEKDIESGRTTLRGWVS